MWPKFIEGPKSLLIVPNIEWSLKENPEKIYTLQICVFGEEHNEKQCKGVPLSVKREKNGKIILTTGDLQDTWTIERLLYVWAQRSQLKMGYFLETRFKQDASTIPDGSIRDIQYVFMDCIGKNKTQCNFLPKLFVHAIDYRPPTHAIEKYVYEDVTISEAQDIMSDILKENYKNVPSNLLDWLNGSTVFKTTTAFPVTHIFHALNDVLSIYTYEELRDIGKEADLIKLFLTTLVVIYGEKFRFHKFLLQYVNDLDDTYYQSINILQKNLNVLLPQWKTFLSSKRFVSITTIFFALQIFVVLHTSKRIVDAIMNPKTRHPSVKMHEGRVISRAAMQLKKVSNVIINKTPLDKLLREWMLDLTLWHQLICGEVWYDWYKKIFSTNGTPHANAYVFNIILDGAYFMDVPAIARMFQDRQSFVSVYYAGDAHRKNVQSFFEYLGFGQSIVFSRENTCVALPKMFISLLNKTTNPLPVKCEYCPSLAELKCNLCDQGHVCKMDEEKWRKHHMCNLKIIQ